MVNPVSPLKRRVHIGAERVAVFVVAPGLFWVSHRMPRGKDRSFVQAVALGTLLVDGWLLTQWGRSR